MKRTRNEARHNNLVHPAPASELVESPPPLPAAPHREGTPPIAEIATPPPSHNFARISLLPVPESAEPSPGDAAFAAGPGTIGGAFVGTSSQRAPAVANFTAPPAVQRSYFPLGLGDSPVLVQRAGEAAPPSAQQTPQGTPVSEGIRAAAGGGSPLDGATRERLESGLGANLGAVRVHDDAQADGLARGVQATAFTSGQDIFFRQGTYNPTSSRGLHLVAHEVAHTVQQSAGPVAGTPTNGGLSISDPSDPFERAATSFADRFIAGAPGASAAPVASVQSQPTPHVMREPAPVGTPTPSTKQSSVEEAAESIHDKIEPRQGADYRPQREAVLTEILQHHDVASQLKSTYQSKYGRDLLDHVTEYMSIEDALRVDEYLNWGRLRGVAKLLLAINGAGTQIETVWRVLPDVHSEGDPVGKWADLVARPIQICKTWASYTLDTALADDLSDGDLDKARALVQYGKLRPIDKIRVSTNRAGTDTALLFEGLREANRTTVRAEYKEAYKEDLDTLLFGTSGNPFSGELSGEDSNYAKTLLDVASDDPDRLIKIVQVAVKGAGTNTMMIWDAINEAIKRRDQPPKPDKLAEIAAAKTQLENLAAKVADKKDELGLKGLWGDLSDADHARLRALLGIRETSNDVPGGSTLSVEVLNDPNVQRLRGMGGLDFDSAREALMKANGPMTQSFAAAWDTKASPLREYLIGNMPENSDQERGLNTILKGSLYERLRSCAGGFWHDDQEDYALNLVSAHATADQRRTLRKALTEIEKGENASDADAGSIISLLKKAFSTSEFDKVRTALQQDTIGVLDRAAELEDNVKREGSDAATDDERRQMAADINAAGRDGKMTPAEEARIRASQDKVEAALQIHVQLREEYVSYASQAASFAVGVIVTAGTGGAAGPAIMAALVRAAVASAMARVITEKTLRGDKFDVLGGDGARAFLGGAVDGAMNVAGAAVALKAMGAVAGAAVSEAIQLGTASLGTKLAAAAIEGAVAGAASGTVESATDEQTWRDGVANGLGNVFIAAIKAAGLGAGLAVGITAAHAGLGHAFGADNPLIAKAKEGNPEAIKQLVPQLGEHWETILDDLANGTGKVEGIAPPDRIALRAALVKHREDLVNSLGDNFGARRTPGAKTGEGSGIDLNMAGDNAGQKLLEVRAYLDKEYGPNWQQKFSLALLVDASRATAVNDIIAGLEPAVRAQVEARIKRTGELYALARRLRRAPNSTLLEPHQLPGTEALAGDELARVRHLVTLDEPARLAARDQAILDSDAAMQRLRAANGSGERADLAAQVTEQQMLANTLNEDPQTRASANESAGGPNPGAIVPFGPAEEQALRTKIHQATQAIEHHSFAEAVAMDLPTEGRGLASVVDGMSPEVRKLYAVAYDGMNNPEIWETVLVNIARETQNVHGPYAHAEITSNQTQAIWNLSQQAAGPNGQVVATPPLGTNHNFIEQRTPFGPRFYDVDIGRGHGMSAHMVQDLVVDEAFRRAGVGMKAEGFRAQVGTETAKMPGEPAGQPRSTHLWNALYDSNAGFTSPDTVTPLLHATLGEVD